MREPTFRRRHTRQQRLLRTGIGVVGIVAVAALVGNMLGGDGPGQTGEGRIAQVAFTGSVRGETEGSSVGPARVKAEADDIIEMLNGWYQTAFVDTSKFGEGTFPEVAALFAEDARTSFTKDIPTLTIGEAREEVERVEPDRSTADVTVFFAKGPKPTYAVAHVRFSATAQMKDDAMPRLRIDQRLTLHLEKRGDDWAVVFYDGKQTQDSIQPTPSGSPS